ncbi:MAG: hypothetical protein IPP71_22435 [Bacteroidetes bacterium]|nr:hypothetical protein [Bacteroidota bacterium]
MRKLLKITIFILTSVVYSSCQREKLDVNVDDIKISTTIKRFEKDLFEGPTTDELEKFELLKKNYGDFLNVFAFKILNIPEQSDSVTASNLSKFVSDHEVSDIYRLTDSVYKSTDEIDLGMESFFRHHKYYFPEKPIPSVVTYISAFNYAVITTDSVIGIGLDMFLGSNIAYYPRLGIPRYLFEKFRKEYIVPSAIKAWFQSDYDVSEVKNELLSQMVYQGKLLYYMNAMAPEMDDTLRTGYTEQQLKWCESNEASIWSFFIENKMLFNTDPSQYSKFVNEGPATNGFPKEAPGKIGTWVGGQIVKAYMNKNSDATLKDLLKEKDAQKILEISGYKPQK